MKINAFCCWPGLASLWYRGHSKGLFLSVLSCWVTSILLTATFVWPEWFNPWILRLSWATVFGFLLTSAFRSHYKLSSLLETTNQRSQAAFVQAQQEYLRGNWFESEAILLELLESCPRDAEAQLLLVAVLRQTKRWQPALRRLDVLEALDGSAAWDYEIRSERKLIDSRIAEAMQSTFSSA